MMTRPAPLSVQCDTDPAEPGAFLSGLLATVGQAIVAAFSWTHQPAVTPEDIPDTASARAKRLMRSGD